MKTGPSNENLVALIRDLKKKSIDEKVNIWKRLAEDLSRSTRQRREVNLMSIVKNAKDGETIVVPGKVLGMGDFTKKLEIAAFRFSGSAAEKIKNAGGKTITLQELMEKNPKGNKVRIIG
jgi:large subunit ribosomal protein L18e